MTEFKCLKAVLSLTFLEINNGGNLLCYYTENDVSTKVRGRCYD